MKIVDVYSKATLNETFIERVDFSNSHSLCKYWTNHSNTDVTNIAFKAQSLLAMKKVYETSSIRQSWCTFKTFSATQTRWGVSKRCWSGSIVFTNALHLSYGILPHFKVTPGDGCKNATLSSFSKANLLSSSLKLQPLALYAYETWLPQSHRILACPLFLRKEITNKTTTRADNFNFNGHRLRRLPLYFLRHGNISSRRFNNHWHKSTPPGQNTKVLQFKPNALPAAKI